MRLFQVTLPTQYIAAAFSDDTPLPEAIRRIQLQVNDFIRDNITVEENYNPPAAVVQSEETSGREPV